MSRPRSEPDRAPDPAAAASPVHTLTPTRPARRAHRCDFRAADQLELMAGWKRKTADERDQVTLQRGLPTAPRSRCRPMRNRPMRTRSTSGALRPHLAQRRRSAIAEAAATLYQCAGSAPRRPASRPLRWAAALYSSRHGCRSTPNAGPVQARGRRRRRATRATFPIQLLFRTGGDTTVRGYEIQQSRTAHRRCDGRRALIRARRR